MTERILTFYLCGELFGIDIKAVKEVNRNMEYTPVPLAPPEIAGLFNMRGQVVTLFNLCTFMKADQGCCLKSPACIILKADTNNPDHVGFLIDKAGDVIDIDRKWCESVPANAASIDGELVREVVKLQDDLVLMLEWEQLLKIDENRKKVWEEQ